MQRISIIFEARSNGAEKWTFFSYSRNLSSSRQNRVLCLMEWERNRVLWAFTKQRDDKFNKVLYAFRCTKKKRNWIWRTSCFMRTIRDLRCLIRSKVSYNSTKLVGWNVLSHAPYSLDFVPSNFHLFLSLQYSLNEKKNSVFGRIEKKITQKTVLLKKLRVFRRRKFPSCIKNRKSL